MCWKHAAHIELPDPYSVDSELDATRLLHSGIGHCNLFVTFQHLILLEASCLPKCRAKGVPADIVC